MALFDKAPELITEQDILDLIANKCREDKRLEFKSALATNSDKQKKEFLADISSFANASGGDLLVGIEATEGIATKIAGLDPSSLDSEILRLENILRDGLDPRIPNVKFQPVTTAFGTVLVIRVFKSWIPPHRVKYGGSSRFYSRHSAGKYELEVSEMRPLFALSSTAVEQIREFRIQRLSKIVAGDTPLQLIGTHRLIIHVVPFAAFDPNFRFDLSSFSTEIDLLASMSNGQNSSFPKHNFQGIVTYAGSRSECTSYFQLFRNGAVEVVSTSFLKRHDYVDRRPELYIYADYERAVVETVSNILSIQKQIGAELPLYVMLSFLGVKNYAIAFSGSYSPGEGNIVGENDLILPEAVIEDFELDVKKFMKPIFQIVWNSAGFSRTPRIHGQWWADQ